MKRSRASGQQGESNRPSRQVKRASRHSNGHFNRSKNPEKNFHGIFL
ncbi:MAG: hypothetical protein PHR96_03840 [Clostridia bacterium]|nr:hypothetical protein [Clostridia bacterium]